MGELKYKYAFDEIGNIVSIEDFTKESSKLHTFKCIVCGGELRPRAIGSKHRRAHFYHKEVVSCNGETYLHKLGKLYIKQHFDNSDKFCISYEVSKTCKEHNCNLRNYNCHKEHEINQVDLKEFYDTCTIEAPIKGFVADLLLTNSKNPNIPPTLIEICVTVQLFVGMGLGAEIFKSFGFRFDGFQTGQFGLGFTVVGVGSTAPGQCHRNHFGLENRCVFSRFRFSPHHRITETFGKNGHTVSMPEVRFSGVVAHQITGRLAPCRTDPVKGVEIRTEIFFQQFTGGSGKVGRNQIGGLHHL